jgi:hypothetical protein
MKSIVFPEDKTVNNTLYIGIMRIGIAIQYHALASSHKLLCEVIIPHHRTNTIGLKKGIIPPGL